MTKGSSSKCIIPSLKLVDRTVNDKRKWEGALTLNILLCNNHHQKYAFKCLSSTAEKYVGQKKKKCLPTTNTD